MDRIVRNKPLSKKVYEALCEDIKQMVVGQNKLPSEVELAKIFGVSRATIREAMNYLTVEGAVTKIQGKGNFGHPSIFDIENRLDLYPDFLELILKKHKDVKLKINYKGISEPTENCKKYFSDKNKEKVYQMDWIYCVEEKPLILGEFEFFTSYLRKLPDKNGPKIEGLQDFSNYYLEDIIAYCVMYLMSGTNSKVSEYFKVSKDTGIQSWEEIIIDINDRKVGFCKFYLHPDEMVMSVVTRFSSD